MLLLRMVRLICASVCSAKLEGSAFPTAFSTALSHFATSFSVNVVPLPFLRFWKQTKVQKISGSKETRQKIVHHLPQPISRGLIQRCPRNSRHGITWCLTIKDETR